MAGPPPTHLPIDPAAEALDAGGAKADVVRRFPASPLAWSALLPRRWMPASIRSPSTPTRGSATTAPSTCSAATAGRGRARCRGEHEPNRGFLTCLAILAQSAKTIGETDEWERCSAFLRDSSFTAYDVLLGS